jgi:hypothetical protein
MLISDLCLQPAHTSDHNLVQIGMRDNSTWLIEAVNIHGSSLVDNPFFNDGKAIIHSVHQQLCLQHHQLPIEKSLTLALLNSFRDFEQSTTDPMSRLSPLVQAACIELTDTQCHIHNIGDTSVIIKDDNGKYHRFYQPDLSNVELSVLQKLQSAHENIDTCDLLLKNSLAKPLLLDAIKNGTYSVNLDQLARLHHIIHSQSFPIKNIEQVVIASRGYMRIVDVFHTITLAELMETIALYGTDYILQHLRTLERDHENRQLFPRLHQSLSCGAVFIDFR